MQDGMYWVAGGWIAGGAALLKHQDKRLREIEERLKRKEIEIIAALEEVNLILRGKKHHV
jgi:hypothetical protein